MAIFRVGQRVRIISAEPGSDADRDGIVGREGTITSIPGVTLFGTPHDCSLEIEGYEYTLNSDFRQLAPLTDPKADEFIERVKGWGPLHEEPKVVPSDATIACTAAGVFEYRDGRWLRISD